MSRADGGSGFLGVGGWVAGDKRPLLLIAARNIHTQRVRAPGPATGSIHLLAGMTFLLHATEGMSPRALLLLSLSPRGLSLDYFLLTRRRRSTSVIDG